MDEYTELWPEVAKQTRLWLSASAEKGLRKSRDDRFLGKLERWLTQGLWNYLGGDFPLSPQGRGVFRLADRSSLVRVIGFFETGNVNGDDFIVPVVGKKSGQKTPQEWINDVANTRDRGTWTKKHVPQQRPTNPE